MVFSTRFLSENCHITSPSKFIRKVFYRLENNNHNKDKKPFKSFRISVLPNY